MLYSPYQDSLNRKLKCRVQIKNVQKKASQLQKDAEKILRTQMKKYPVLQPYARTPYTTYLIRLVFLIPFVIFLGPLLGLIGSLGKPGHQLHVKLQSGVSRCTRHVLRNQVYFQDWVGMTSFEDPFSAVLLHAAAQHPVLVDMKSISEQVS